jgi:hypothetical protein
VAGVYTWHLTIHYSSLTESALLGIQLFISNKPTNNHLTLDTSFVIDPVYVTAHQYQTHLFNRILSFGYVVCLCVQVLQWQVRCFHTKSLSTHTQQRNGNANRLPDVLQFILNLIKLHENPVAAAASCVH